MEEQRKLSEKMEKASKVAEQLEDKIQKLEEDMRFYSNTNRVAPDAVEGMARDYTIQKSTLPEAVSANKILQRIVDT